MDYQNYNYRDCLYSIIQCQQSLIKRYEEYIENNICKPIKKYSKEDFDIAADEFVQYQHITIPQADIMMKCDYRIAREFDIIKAEFPVFPLHLIEQYVNEKLLK